jgi:signal transduction histidine kinase
LSALSRLYARASGIPLLVTLLIVTFAIAGDLAHEAWETARVQRETADRALHDYTRFAAATAADRARSSITAALSALFAGIGAERSGDAAAPAPPDVLARNAERIVRCRCAPSIPALAYFRLDLSPPGDTMFIVAAGAAPPSELAWVRDTLGSHVRARTEQDGGISLLYGTPPAGRTDTAGAGRIVGYTVRSDSAGSPARVYGVVSTVTAFAGATFADLARSNDLSADVSDLPIAHDSLVSTIVADARGRPLFDANPRRSTLELAMMPRIGHETYQAAALEVRPVTLFADTIALGPQFGGLALQVALRSSAPDRIIGVGLPRSRLLVLFGLLVLMAGLVAVAILQIRREHELARLRAEFTTSVSHELRTPLAQILLYGETLILERTRSDRERRSAAEVIVREARRLMHLVENALHFARTDRQLLELKPEPVALAALTREILVTFAPLAWAADVTLVERLDETGAALIDRDAFRQILLNLLDNAVKYGPHGQTVTVRLWREADFVRVAVEDQGPGVQPADRLRIWTPFVRASNGTPTGASQTGTGIGLAVVRDLTTRHGGRAWVEGSASGGARFVLELPATDPAGTLNAPTTSESRQSSLTGL